MLDEDTQRFIEIKERASAASAGPWKRTRGITGTVICRHNVDHTDYEQIIVAYPYANTVDTEKDLQFIENAREDVPWLVGQIEQLMMRLKESNGRYFR